MLCMGDDKKGFDPLDTHTDIGPLEKAEACFEALYYLDTSTAKAREKAMDTINRAMMLYDMAGRPDRVVDVMRHVKMLDPVKDKRLYIKAILYHQEQFREKRRRARYERARIEDYDDTRHYSVHKELASGLADEIGLESVLLGFDD